jgi:hypothetical protein
MTSTQDNSWPFDDRPGVPVGPERDGWHWLDGEPGKWIAADGIWYVYAVPLWDETDKWRDVAYGGPCLTPAEHAAAIAAARAEGMMEAARIVGAAGLSGGGYAAVIMSAIHGPPKEYDYRDNAPHDVTSATAIRARGQA